MYSAWAYNDSRDVRDKLLLSREIALYGKKSMFAFQEVFTKAGKIFISGGALGAGQ